MRARFQNGWVRTKRRKEGEVWFFEWRDYSAGGITRSMKIGPVSKYKTESDVLRAVELKRMDINGDVEAPPPALMTVGALIAHYRKHEINTAADVDHDLASSTKDGYDSYIANHILPKWKEVLLSEVKPIAIENWLRSLTCKPDAKGKVREMARGTRLKIKTIMSAIFDHGMRYELAQKNPTRLVRQSGKREHIPEILTVDEFRLLLCNLNPRERVMVLLAAGTGLRRGELFALKWMDIDFEAAEIQVTRSITHNTKRERIGRCKTEASRKPVPLDPITAAQLQEWHAATTYNQAGDWIFASARAKGKWPLWPKAIMDRFVRPAAKKAGVTKSIGWHTFRHSFSTLLSAFGTDLKVMQELMRHANITTTMNVYTQAMTAEKRNAQAKVVRAFVN
jgi:integrase